MLYQYNLTRIIKNNLILQYLKTKRCKYYTLLLIVYNDAAAIIVLNRNIPRLDPVRETVETISKE